MVKRWVLYWGSVVCFFPVCCKGPLRVRGEHNEWRPWDPLHSWEETAPLFLIESTEAECSELNKKGAKGFVSGSLPSSSPRIPGNLGLTAVVGMQGEESTKALVFLS